MVGDGTASCIICRTVPCLCRLASLSGSSGIADWMKSTTAGSLPDSGILTAIPGKDFYPLTHPNTAPPYQYPAGWACPRCKFVNSNAVDQCSCEPVRKEIVVEQLPLFDKDDNGLFECPGVYVKEVDHSVSEFRVQDLVGIAEEFERNPLPTTVAFDLFGYR